MATIEVSEQTEQILKEIACYASENSKFSDGTPIYENSRSAINYLIGYAMVYDSRINEIVTRRY